MLRLELRSRTRVSSSLENAIPFTPHPPPPLINNHIRLF